MRPEKITPERTSFFHYRKAFMIKRGDVLATVKRVREEKATKHSLKYLERGQ